MREYEYLKKLRTDSLENMKELYLSWLHSSPGDLVTKSILKDVEDELQRRKEELKNGR